MLNEVTPIRPLSAEFEVQLKKVDDFYVCTNFIDEMIGPPIALINNAVYFRFMNFIYSPQPPESLTSKKAKDICDIRLEYIDRLVNYHLNSSVVDTISECVAAKYSNSPAPLKSLDFGCGNGLSSQMLLERMPKLDLIGVDISQKAIAFCDEQKIRARLIASDEPLPFETASFDLIFAIFVMHFNIDLQALGELRRILRPSGSFVFNVYQKDIEGLIARLEEVGFCSINLWERLYHIGNNHAIISCSST